MFKKHKNRSITLLELMISLVVLSIIVMGFTSIELFSRYQLVSSDRHTAMQNGAVQVIEHITKQLVNAIGRFDDPAVVAYADGKGFRARIDNNPANGQIDGTDGWIAYRQEPFPGNLDSEIRFYSDAGAGGAPAGGYETIAKKIKITWGMTWASPATSNLMDINITTCWDPAEITYPCGFGDNVTVTMRSRIKMPSVSTN